MKNKIPEPKLKTDDFISQKLHIFNIQVPKCTKDTTKFLKYVDYPKSLLQITEHNLLTMN